MFLYAYVYHYLRDYVIVDLLAATDIINKTCWRKMSGRLPVYNATKMPK